ncbi:MAG: PilN domain-containing protein [Methylococcales bacterium]|nr:PilN domain-containing protein [Methylococcales bacterium]
MNLNKNVKIEFKPFLRWWGRELAFLIPAKIRQFFHAPRVAIIIRPINEQFEFSYEINGQQEILTTVARDISSAEIVKNLISPDRFKNAIFILRLSNHDALNKTLNLPLAAQTNVLQVVSYELDRYSPFKADQIYFATRLERIDTEAAQLIVQLMIVPRKSLETLYQNCKTLDISLDYVDVENCPNDLQKLHSAYNLLPPHLQPKIANTPRRVIAGLVALLVILSVASLALPVWLEYQAVENLQAKIAKIEKEVKAVKTLQAEMDTMREENQALINEKTATPLVVSILNEISRLMKDDSWLSYLQYSEGQLQLQGESPTASNLLADLEASDYFAKANFVSPVTQDKASGMERFQISAEITKPANSENSDVTTEITETATETVSESADETPTETTVEDVTTEEAVTENGTPQE